MCKRVILSTQTPAHNEIYIDNIDENACFVVKLDGKGEVAIIAKEDNRIFLCHLKEFTQSRQYHCGYEGNDLKTLLTKLLVAGRRVKRIYQFKKLNKACLWIAKHTNIETY